jgi:PAS domain S-box-containing protein
MSDQPATRRPERAAQLRQRIAELEAENAALRERIAAYQNTEQQLHASEERFRAVFDASPDSIFLQSYPSLPDEPMRFIDCNATVCAIIGQRREDLIGKPISSFNPYPLTLAEELSYAQLVRTGKRVVIETDVPLADGTHLISEVLSTLISVAGQEIILGIGRDITQRKKAEQELRASEERFRAVFDTSPDPMLLVSYPSTNEPMRLLDCNSALCMAHGLSREQLIGVPSASFALNPFTDDEREIYIQRLRSGERVVHDTVQRHSDGSLFTLEVASTNITIAGQDTILAVARDITQRKKAEAEIRFQSKLLESVGQAIIAVDLEGTIIYWNKAAEQLLGWPADEVLGQPGLQLIEQTDIAADFRATLAILLAQGFWAGEMRQQRRDRSIFSAYISSSFFFDNSDKPAGIISSITDLTPIKQVEEQLRLLNLELEQRVALRTEELVAANLNLSLLNRDMARSHGLLAIVFNKLSDGLALLDNTGKLLVVNETLAQLVGAPAEPMAGQPWASLGLAELDLNTSSQCQITYNAPHSQRVMLEIQSDLITTSSPELSLLLVRVIDITERLHLETITLQNERLAASGRLAEVIAHEVNTPLQAMQNLVYLAQISPKGQSDRYLSLVHDEIRRVSATVKRMLDLNRGASDTWEMLDCNALIERMLLLTEMLLLSRHITIVRELSTNLVQVWGNADSLCQVLLNLIINASDAMPQGGTLTLRSMLRLTPADATAEDPSLAGEADPDDLRLIIEVQDSGDGIEPQLLESIFQPFFTTKAVGTGTGLGLSISQRIIHEHGGRIWAASRIGHGTTLTVDLPIYTNRSTNGWPKPAA